MDFRGSYTGFTYNGIHSSVFGIARTSSGKFYEENLVSGILDKTTEKPGSDGSYHFYSNHSKKEFVINFAFYNITDEQKRLIEELWSDGNIHSLIFDEAPYKVYSAKITGNSVMKEISFEENGQRVYCGEGSFVFTCYYPYALSRYQFSQDYNANNIHDWAKQQDFEILHQDLLEKRGSFASFGVFKYDEFNNENNSLNGSLVLQESDFQDWLYDEKLLRNFYDKNTDITLNAKTFFGYEENEHNNILEWLEGSDIPDNLKYGKLNLDSAYLIYNAGDMEMPIRVWYKAPQTNNEILTISLRANDSFIITSALKRTDIHPDDYYIVVDTDTKTIQGYNSRMEQTSNLYNRFLVGGSQFFQLPRGKNELEIFGVLPINIEYQYIYY